MAKFAVEISVGVNQGELVQAERAYKRLGLSAEDAMKRTDGLARSADKGSTQIREATLRAAASFESFSRSVERGGGGSERSLIRLNVRIEELRQAIDRAKAEGAPVSDDALATLRALESQTDENVKALGRLKAAQDDVADSVRDAKGTFDGQGRQVNDLTDLLDVMGGKWGKVGLQVVAAYGAMKAGWQIGNDVRDGLDAIARELLGIDNATNKLIQKTPQFRAFTAVLERMYGVSDKQLASSMAAHEAARERYLRARMDRFGNLLSLDGKDPFAEEEAEYIEWYLEQQDVKARAAEDAAERAARAAEQAAERELAALKRVVDARNKLFEAQWQAFQGQSLGMGYGAIVPDLRGTNQLSGEVGGWLDDLADSVDTSADSLEAAIRMEREYQRALDDHQAQINENIANWASLFNFLADEFGGVFNYIAQGMQALQNAQALSSNVSGLGQSAGMSASAAGAMGSFAATAYLFYVAYKETSAHIKRQDLKRYGNAGEYSLVGGEEGTTRLDANGFELVKAIRGVIEEFERALRVSVTDLDKIGIRIRNDGKYIAAYVQGEMIGHFESVDEAIRAALMQTIMRGGAKFQGLPDLIAQGMDEWTVPDADEMMAFLQSLRAIADLNLSDSAIQFQQWAAHMDELFEALDRLSISPAVIQGLLDLGAAEVAALQAWSDSITGRQKTREELLKEKQRDAELFNAEKALRLAEYRLREADLQAEMAYLTGKRSLLQQDANLKQAELELYQAYLEAMGKVIAALAAIPDINLGDIRIDTPGAGGGGGGGGGSSAGARRDLREEIEALGLGSVGSALLGADQWLADFAARVQEAGYSAEESARLMGLLEAEHEKQRQRIRRDTLEAARDFIRQGTPAGGALMGGLRGVDEQLEGMVDNLEELRDAGEITRNKFRQLKRNLEEAGEAARARMIADAGSGFVLEMLQLLGREEEAAQLKYQLTLAEYQIRRAELELAMRTYGMLDEGLLQTIDQLIRDIQAAGPGLFGGGGGAGGGTGNPPSGQGKYLGDEQISGGRRWRWDGAKWVDIGAWNPGGGGTGTGGTNPDAIDRDRDRAMSILGDWKNAGEHPLVRDIREWREQLDFLKRILGETAEVQEAGARRYAEIINRYLDPIRDYRRGMDFTAGSVMRGDQQFYSARDQFRALEQSILSGDLTGLDRVIEYADLYRQLAGEFTGGSERRFIEAEIKAALDRITQLAPQIATGGNPLGVAANPMTMVAPQLQQSLETGNTMLLAEARLQTGLLRLVVQNTHETAAALNTTLSVRDVA